jgi:hypothetical protein
MKNETSRPSPHIGTLAEKSLHAALKEWYGRDGDQFEVKVDGRVIDIVRGQQLIEIQTRHLYAMRRKLATLLPNHPVTIIHPIPQAKWIVRQEADGTPVSRRKSPKRGQFIDIFRELARLTMWLPHPNLTICVALTHEEEIWRNDGQGSWRRRGWSLADRLLLQVADTLCLHTPDDYLQLLPNGLPPTFTNKALAQAAGCRPALAQQMSYTLRKMGLVTAVGKQERALLMAITKSNP